jgi:replicative DNA helicase
VSERAGPSATPARKTASDETGALLQAVVAGSSANGRVTTGYPSLDYLLGGGLRRGDVVVLGGDVGAGKSALALAMAIRAAAAGHAVAFLSGEMSAARIAERALAMEGKLSLGDLRRDGLDDSTHAAVASTALRLRDRAPVFESLSDHGVAGVSDLLVGLLGLELVVVDSMQYLVTGASAYDDELASVARGLKELAMRRATVVLAVSHLGRAVRERPNPRPSLEDFGGLGAIRQQADIVLGLFREELYDQSPQLEGAAELHVLKNRNGPTGFVDLYFYKQWLRFEDMVDE